MILLIVGQIAECFAGLSQCYRKHKLCEVFARQKLVYFVWSKHLLSMQAAFIQLTQQISQQDMLVPFEPKIHIYC